MFAGFKSQKVDTGELALHVLSGGKGAPLLLLHGFPQTHVMWHKIAPNLAAHFHVVCPDLRGYGDSDKPTCDTDHSRYSKRVMAQDMIRLMEKLGFPQFSVAGHDRGGRVVHRMIRDSPASVEKAAVLDIVPTLKIFETIDQAVSTAYYHWFFLIQSGGLPEHMIGLDPEYYLRDKLKRWSAIPDAFSEEAIAEYVRCFSQPDAIHASCEDYRAGASIDLDHDRQDRDRKTECPLLVLWGERGAMDSSYDVLGTWQEVASNVQGNAIDSGHFLAEEAPAETLQALTTFFRT